MFVMGISNKPMKMPKNIRGDIFFAVKPEIVGVAGANMQWSRFLCPQLQLILRSTWRLSSPSKQVVRSSTPCQKGSQVLSKKVNEGQNICSRDASVENGEKQAQC